MSNSVKRGFIPTDAKEFNEESLNTLIKAQKDLLYLMEQGYPIKSASTFVGNHYMISERQRLALSRATTIPEIVELRRKKQVIGKTDNQTLYLDGLNLIITLEVALSGSVLIHCMDGTIRDLAGLRGTYRLIDKTDLAINLIGKRLNQMNIDTAHFYLDSPVSNTGRLKQRICELLAGYSFHTIVELVNNADVMLENKSNVISSDAIILNKCTSWINLAAEIMNDSIKDTFLVDLRLMNAT
ncbi:DUF434 domain-containing protein [Anaerocolumna sp. AGMB13025]|uniref:DUF434 domain-containing protein n=1 Tax=Anaerocolumna sp. AGMB13025 TaxID=3039116 RepID=UPI00241C977C|nr:DUF434 domain-containing protein [Anaerocolumna sp. AGMB13025]WFR54946.1 DUF434 domain-containing protein [Anaerocolumna sp. AGMB13025]